MRRLPPFNALRAFDAAARHLNFRLPAEELGVTQGAVAQQIRGLEAESGISLFERHPRGLALTEAGRGYQPNIRRAFDIIQEATSLLRPGRRHVTISVTPTFASKWLIPRLADFTDAYPDIDVRIVATDRISDFQADGVDVAVRLGRPPFGPDVTADLLLPHVIVAVGSPLLIEKFGHPEVVANFEHYPLLHDAHNLWPRFLENIPSLKPTPNQKAIRFNQTALAVEAAIAGQGLTLAGSLYVEDDIASGRLLQLFGTSLAADSGFFLVSQANAQSHAAISSFTSWLRGVASRDPEPASPPTSANGSAKN